MSNTIMCKKCDKKSNIQSTPNAVERARNAIGSLVLNQRDIVNAAVENALIATGNYQPISGTAAKAAALTVKHEDMYPLEGSFVHAELVQWLKKAGFPGWVREFESLEVTDMLTLRVFAGVVRAVDMYQPWDKMLRDALPYTDPEEIDDMFVLLSILHDEALAV